MNQVGEAKLQRNSLNDFLKYIGFNNQSSSSFLDEIDIILSEKRQNRIQLAERCREIDRKNLEEEPSGLNMVNHNKTMHSEFLCNFLPSHRRQLLFLCTPKTANFDTNFVHFL